MHQSQHLSIEASQEVFTDLRVPTSKLIIKDSDTGEQNSPFYTFFPHFAGRMGLHFGDFPKFIFSEWGEGFGEAVWGNIRQNGVYSPFCVFF